MLSGLVFVAIGPLWAMPAFAAEGAAPKLPAQSVVHTRDARDLKLIATLNAFIPKLIAAKNVPGLNIALARHGEIVWEAAYGYADAKSLRPMRTDTVFHSGSMAKPYTALSIMQLVEEGRLQLDDPINKYLPFEVKNPLGGPPITVRHLLTHTAGLGREAAMSYFCEDPTTVRSLVENMQKAYEYQHGQAPIGLLYLHRMWTGQAGRKYEYSNLSVATVGLVVERANREGLNYGDYVQKKVLEPLGTHFAQYPIAQTRTLVRPDIWERMSTGYQTLGGAWVPTAQVCFGEYPAGGLLATPSDHLRMVAAIAQGGEFKGVRILKPESVSTLLTPQPSPAQTALIWRLSNWSSPNRSFWHTGGHMFGWHTTSRGWPNSRTAFVAAANAWNAIVDGDPALPEISDLIDAWLAAETAGSQEKFVVPTPKAPTAPRVPSMENINWKASYLRGLLYAESYQLGIAVPERLTESQMRALASNTDTSVSAWQPALWDAEGFVSGVKDMTALAASPQAIRDFAADGRMRISLEEARQLFPLLAPHAVPGGRSWATLGGLLRVKSN